VTAVDHGGVQLARALGDQDDGTHRLCDSMVVTRCASVDRPARDEAG
jgi:hypothetical protein